MGIAAIVVIVSPRVFFQNGGASNWAEYIQFLGFALILLGQIIRVSARGYKAEHSQDSQALIQGGPYQVVRNPMYLGIFLIGLGVVLAVFKWWVAGIFSLVFMIRYLTLIFQEEKKLRSFFPQSYPQYCQSVPRILPKITSLMKLDLGAYLPMKIIWFQKEIGSMITLFALLLLAKLWMGLRAGKIQLFLEQLLGLGLIFILSLIFIWILSKRTAKIK